MAHFTSQKLSVNVIPPANNLQPIIGRKYTLTHSDATAELFLDVGYVFNVQAINPKMRDEVLGEWQYDCHFVFVGHAYVDNGEFSKEVTNTRFHIFQKEMPTAIRGMMNGDQAFFSNYPYLLHAPISIYFHSTYTEYNQVFFYGTPRQYLSPIPIHNI
ncbi:Staygreen protein [Oceanobacillus limi]|uniref:Staygreen protein n=1 Tax=Oceanobacillus limi TaxID=930131 RepID=A0A1H9YI35_9BACI|nr:staygreen family protein [Oceanobacillus limi]SES68645.1 Staygreen protein [Oceanobacillus limi]